VAGGPPAWRLGPARRLLLAAWMDVSAGFHEWAVVKAWSAALYRAAGPYGGLGPGGWPSVAYLLAGLSGSCGALGGLLGCAAALDALVAPLQHPEVVAVLDVELGYARREALDAIECAVRVASALDGCAGGSLEPAVPAGLVSGAIERVSEALAEASLAWVGGTHIIAYGGARGLPYSERVRRFPAPLPPVRVLLLAPEEAALLLALPPWRAAAREFARDDYGLEAVGPGLLGGPSSGPRGGPRP